MNNELASVNVSDLDDPIKAELVKPSKKKKGKKGKKKKKSSGADESALQSNKSAQMVFKAALRNHLGLSSLADGKASTMLTVNTLVITIALPFLLPSIENHPNLIFPGVVLLITCLVSIVFATLVTQPGRMNGETTDEQLKEGKGDLFFFGNFFNMDFLRYKKGMEITLENQDRLDETIFRNLFTSGTSLGRKYIQLRYCYGIFIVGLVISVLSFLVLSLMEM